MRIGIASDLHLGFGSGRRKGDALKQAERAMEELLSHDVDVILLAGDVFDSPVPRPEALKDAANVLRRAQKYSSDVSFTGIGRDTPRLKGTPVLAIHGNHERRVRGDINPVKLMDIMGYLVYLHDSGVMSGNFSFYGVGSVPESYSRRVFKSLSVKPVTDSSFFVFHQDLDPYIPRAKLKLSHLPKGFRYYINGHVHSPRLEKNLLIVGSTVVTQMKPEESEKFVWVWDDGFQKHNIPSRPLHYIKVDADGRKPSEVLDEVDEAIQKVLGGEDPMIRVRVVGSLAKGFRPSDLVFINDYDAIVNFHKDLEGSAMAKADVSEVDIDDMAVAALNEVLKDRGLKVDASRLYRYLLKGDESGIWKLLEGEV